MSLWDKVKKVGKSVGGYTSATMTGGALNTNGGGWAQGGDLKSALSGSNKKGTNGIQGLVGGGNINDLLMGKKAKDIKPDDIANQIRSTQMKGVKELNKALDTSGESVIRQGAQAQKNTLITSAQDARRNAQQTMAQRGLKNSSLSLALDNTVTRDTGEQVAAVNSAIPGQIRNQQIQDAQTRINVGGINQNGMNFNTIEGNRSGGILGIAGALAPAIGAGVGAAYGGSAGAQMGSQAGSGISGALSQQQNPGQNPYDPNKYKMGSYQF